MLQDASSMPHNLTQALWLVLASILGILGGWFARRNREPAEIRRIDAEARNIHITAENAQVGVGLEILREMREANEKADKRREEWLAREDQLRTQVLFWRNKAEELDGELADSRQANAQLMSQAKLNDYQLRKQMSFIEMEHLKEKYIALDTPRDLRGE